MPLPETTMTPARTLGESDSARKAPLPRPAADRPARLTYRLADLPEVLGVSARTIARERSAGRFPRPDLLIGKAPLWRTDTIAAYLAGGGR